jgi:transposase
LPERYGKRSTVSTRSYRWIEQGIWDRIYVERLINRLKQFRRLATRYEKRGKSYHAMWVIAATLLWL